MFGPPTQSLFDKNSNFDFIFSQSSKEPSKVIELIPHPPINTLYVKYWFIADMIDTWLVANVTGFVVLISDCKFDSVSLPILVPIFSINSFIIPSQISFDAFSGNKPVLFTFIFFCLQNSHIFLVLILNISP